LDYEQKIGDLIHFYHISPTELLGMTLDRIDWLYALMFKTHQRHNQEKKDGKNI